MLTCLLEKNGTKLTYSRKKLLGISLSDRDSPKAKDRQASEQTNQATCKQTDKPEDSQPGKKTERHVYRQQWDGWTDRRTINSAVDNRRTDRSTIGQADRQWHGEAGRRSLRRQPGRAPGQCLSPAVGADALFTGAAGLIDTADSPAEKPQGSRHTDISFKQSRGVGNASGSGWEREWEGRLRGRRRR